MTRRARLLRWAPHAAAALFVLLIVADAFARPGGGGTFSGGSRSGGGSGSSSSGGGGDGGGEIVGFIIGLLWDVLPWQVKVPLVIAIGVGLLFKYFSSKQNQDWSTGTSDASSSSSAPSRTRGAPANVRRTLAGLRAADPDFSLVLFEDFLYALYGEVKLSLGRGQIDQLSAYLAPEVIAALKTQAQAPTRAVVIGAMRYVDISDITGGSAVEVTVDFEANMTAAARGGEQSVYLLERWTVSRSPSARSRPPARARVLDCPSCGAPLSAVIAGTCTHCRQTVSTGQFDWVVRRALELQREAVPPLLTGQVEETGTSLPTIVDPRAPSALAALSERDPSFTWGSFQQRIGLVFHEFQVAWTARDLAKMRGYLSDNLFQTESYWISAYTTQHLRNVSENAKIEGIELARVESDAAFDAITVRVRAAGLDYTLADDGRLVSGSRSRPRRYTEYWTFIRGASRAGPTKTEAVCPNCGAPLEVNMAGDCRYCKAKVTSGEFDWVLSRIEQDEVYAG